MFDFITENILIFVIVGGIIILIAIGYIVDKFIINKGSEENRSLENEKNIPKAANSDLNSNQENLNHEVQNNEVYIEDNKKPSENEFVQNFENEAIQTANNDINVQAKEEKNEQNLNKEFENLSTQSVKSTETLQNNVNTLNQEESASFDATDENIVVIEPLFSKEQENNSK